MLTLLFAVISASPEQATLGLQSDPEIIDLGMVEPTKFTVPIKLHATHPVEQLRARSSCGCQSPRIPADTLGAGGIVNGECTLDLTGQSGLVEQYLLIDYRDLLTLSNLCLTIPVKALVQPSVWLDPAALKHLDGERVKVCLMHKGDSQPKVLGISVVGESVRLIESDANSFVLDMISAASSKRSTVIVSTDSLSIPLLSLEVQ